ncbi:Tetratricopeptide repeat-containing protein [Neolewinella agarilytica]|uniref:Tetratricopeptide repeat-containing protein n=2 Tax=Neolewinella agarilytica TaxID=478744 RepID=A0A1H9DV30_9BACT|nr:Tetratricopeptide repeat-containing protein [Neolewinella agarilytica]
MRHYYLTLLLLSLIILPGCALKQNTVPDAAVTEVESQPTALASIAEVLKANDHRPVAERIALYRQLRKEQPEAYNFWNQDELTMYGYGLLWGEKTTEAIEVFKLMVAEFPNTANNYDSLGEAYLANGDEEKALVNYQKALKMDPDNFNAEDIVYRLRHPGFVPETDEEKFAKVYTAAEYSADLDQLAARLLKVHPNALKFISAEDFRSLIEQKKALMTDQTTYAEFRWHCAEIIASVNCSHTSMGRFSLESKMLPTALRFPVQTRLVDGQLFVVDPMGNDDRLAVKDEILSVNDIPVASLLKDIYRRIPSQGYVETTKRHEFNFWGTGMIAYAMNFPQTYEVTVKGKSTSIVLSPAKEIRNHFGNPAIKGCGEPLCYEVLEDGKSAVLTVLSFNFYPWNNLDVFEAFMDKTFRKIAADGIEQLIIDLRYNGGGSSESSIYLLRHLMQKPFTYYSRAEYEGKQKPAAGESVQLPFDTTFQGKLYFLIDGIGNSTTGHFMSLAQKWELGTIIGEELGSNQFCSAGQTVCRLSNTKVLYYVANNTHVSTATSLPDETGILPDHYVSQSIDDYLNEIDTVLEFAIGLTRM